MAIDAGVRAALRPFERRAVLVAFIRAFATTLVATAIVTDIAFLAGMRTAAVLVLFVAVGLIGSLIYAVHHRPTLLVLARRIDARANLNELLVSAIECQGDGMPSLVRSASVAALQRVPVANAFPFEPPRHWRRWLIGAVVIQVIALPLLFRAPAPRAQAPTLSSLSLPSISPAANAATPRDLRNPTTPQSSAPQPAAGPSPRVSTDATRTEASPTTDVLSSGAAGTAGGSDDRLRLAAAGADDDIAAGRVPIARRAIVERYFAAIQTLRKRPR